MLIKVFLHLLCKTKNANIFHVLLRLTAVFQMMALLTPMDMKRLVCEGTDLDQYVYFGSQAEKEAFRNVCCALSPQQLINSQQVLLQNLQPRKVLSEVRFPLFSHLVSKWSLVLFGNLEDYFCQASKLIIYVGHALLVDCKGSLGRSQKDRNFRQELSY